MMITVDSLKQQLFNTSWSYPFAVAITVISMLLMVTSMNGLWQSMQIGNTKLESSSHLAATRYTQDSTSIAEWHLFGDLPPEQVNLQALPETILSLELNGVILNENPQASIAIILVAGGQEDFYAIGDSVPGGATIYDIFSDRVILQRDNRLELLALPDEPIKQEV